MGNLAVTSDPVALPGTMLNPFKTLSTSLLSGSDGKRGGQVYLPAIFHARDKEATLRNAMIFHSLALFGTWGLGAAGLSYLVDSFSSRARQEKRRKDIKPGVMATYVPVLQRDVKDMLPPAEKPLGLVSDLLKQPVPDSAALAVPRSELEKQAGWKTQSVPKTRLFYLSFVLPATAVALGISAGSKFGSNVYNVEQESELDKSIAEKAKELDALTMERLRWARGKREESKAAENMEKTAQWYNVLRYPEYLKAAWKGGKSVTEDVAAAMTAMAMGTTGAAALATYTLARRHDPNVLRYRALEQGFRELARSQARGTASTIQPIPKDIQEELDAMVAGKPLPEIPVSTTKTVSVDPSDQSLKLL